MSHLNESNVIEQGQVAKEISGFVDCLVSTTARTLQEATNKIQMESSVVQFKCKMKAMENYVKMIAEQRESIVELKEKTTNETETLFYDSQLAALDGMLHKKLEEAGIPAIEYEEIEE